ncbi:taste receptor type 2 member 1-like [Phyllobates terribilis]|uniref:taste receptor type 2 member 1-like n=1 Tax=Phyllobates terribilis TaxID=111132 RepID=UPI003CCAA704
MLQSVDLWKFVMMVIIFTPGTALNSMIISIYYTDWRGRQHFSPCDQILLSISLTNLTMQMLSTLILIMLSFFVELPYVQLYLLHICIFSQFLTYVHFWNTAWLSSYYCFKLVSCSHRYFTWLKNRFSSSIVQTIGISLVVIFLITLPINWMAENTTIHNETRYHFDVKSPYVAFNLLLGCEVPLLVTLTCIGLSVTSLLRHVWRIKKNRSEVTSRPQVKGHVRAVRVMVLQTLLNVTLHIANSGFFLFSWRLGSILDGIFHFLVLVNPTADALMLITGNPKLKSRLLRRFNVFCQKV